MENENVGVWELPEDIMDMESLVDGIKKFINSKYNGNIEFAILNGHVFENDRLDIHIDCTVSIPIKYFEKMTYKK